MKRKMALMAQEIEYTLKTSARTRRVWFTIREPGEFVVSAPEGTSQEFIEHLIAKKLDWVMDRLAYFKRIPQRRVIEVGRHGFDRYKHQALALVSQRLAYFNSLYGFRFNKVMIRNQKARWASCSQNGNLSFNYKIALLPPHLSDYIIVHELCHLVEMNHSKHFWAQVARVFPHYRALRAELKRTMVY